MSKYVKLEDIEAVLADKHMNRPLDSDRWVIRDIGKAIESLPPVEPQRPKGEWIEYIDDRNGRRYCKCTSCNKTTLNAIEYDVLDGERHIMDFCPKCGADMRGADDE